MKGELIELVEDLCFAKITKLGCKLIILEPRMGDGDEIQRWTWQYLTLTTLEGLVSQIKKLKEASEK